MCGAKKIMLVNGTELLRPLIKVQPRPFSRYTMSTTYEGKTGSM